MMMIRTFKSILIVKKVERNGEEITITKGNSRTLSEFDVSGL